MKPIIARAMLIVSISFFFGLRDAAAEIRTEAAILAIQRYVCFQNFWNGRQEFQLGHGISMALRRDNDNAYAWSEGLSVMPHISKWATFFELRSKDDRVIVQTFRGFNLQLMSDASEFLKLKSLVFRSRSEEIVVQLPADCSPRHLPTNDLKRRMLKVIKNSVGIQLGNLEKKKFKAGSKQTIIIADFDTDDPWTSVFVPETADMFEVLLRDASDPFGDLALREGEYPSGLISNDNWVRILKKKLMIYGVTQTATIGGG